MKNESREDENENPAITQVIPHLRKSKFYLHWHSISFTPHFSSFNHKFLCIKFTCIISNQIHPILKCYKRGFAWLKEITI